MSEPLLTVSRIKPIQELEPEIEGHTNTNRMFSYEIIREENDSTGLIKQKNTEVLRVSHNHQDVFFEDGDVSNESGGESPFLTSSYDFVFNRIISSDGDQEYVYKVSAKNIVDSFLEGYNGCVFCYGQTCSGKTYTMVGGDTYGTRGIIPRALTHIFNTDSLSDYKFRISFLEIYNEIATDLLLPHTHSGLPVDNSGRVELFEERGKTEAKNLTWHIVTTEDEAVDLFMIGNARKIISSTPSNPLSSRSHTMFTIEMNRKVIGNMKHEYETTHNFNTVSGATLHLVDLAGSERAWKTRLDHEVLKESKYINRSLHFLEQVVQSLHLKSRSHRFHVPYRNSLLTSFLRDALGGNCKTLMIANLSCEKISREETISTCRFAARCSRLTHNVTTNQTVDWKEMSQRLLKENEILRVENRNLRDSYTVSNIIPPLQGPEVSDEHFAYIYNSELPVGNHNFPNFRIDNSHSQETYIPLTCQNGIQNIISYALDVLPDSQINGDVSPIGNWKISDILLHSESNLALFSKSERKIFLKFVKTKGLDISFRCASDLCAIIQVLLAKMKTDEAQKTQ